MKKIEFRIYAKAWKPPQFVKPEDLYLYGNNTFVDVLRLMNDSLFVFQRFTGLLDSKDKKIFEGDIMNVNPNWSAYASQRPIVTFENGCFMLDIMLLYHMNKSMQVIGNIFENPELINKKV